MKKKTIKLIILVLVILIGTFGAYKSGIIIGFNTTFKESINLKEGSFTTVKEYVTYRTKLESSDENIVSIDEDKLIGKKPGKATITIIRDDKKVGEYEVTVELNEEVQNNSNTITKPEPQKQEKPNKQKQNKPTKTEPNKPAQSEPNKPINTTPSKPVTIDVTSVEIINNSESLTVGNKVSLRYTIIPENATNKSVTWTSSNENVATVNNGEVIAKKEGNATITLKTNNGKIATAKINVVSNEVKITGISLIPKEIEIKLGETVGLTVNITPIDATNKNITWTSSNTNVATVNNGTVKALKVGTTIITAKSDNNKTATSYVTVKEIDATGISLNKTSAQIKVGESTTITATITPNNTTNKSITWTSSNTNVATVNNGVIKGISAGSTTITVKTSNGKIATCNVTVSKDSCGTSKIHFMNTGSSDAFIIESCGHFGLVDSSNPRNDGTAYAVSSYTHSVEHVIDYLKKITGCSGSNCKGKLEFVVATHSHSDHIGGMPRIASVFVNSKTTYYYRQYLKTGEDTSTDWDNQGYYSRALNAMKSANAVTKEITNKDTTFGFYDLTVKLLNTASASSDEKVNGIVARENKNSIIQLITHKNGVKVLLTADMEKEDEQRVKDNIGKVNVLKIGHHSYSSSTSKAFIKTLKPDTMIVSNEAFDTTDTMCYGLRINSKAKIYITSSAEDAIVLKYTDTSYTIKNDTGGSISSKTPCKSGWLKDGCWYYYSNSGTLLKGWQKLSWSKGTNWFYFKSDGCMLENTTQTIDGKKYHFDSNGVCDSDGC